jgi:hypothetical protein
LTAHVRRSAEIAAAALATVAFLLIAGHSIGIDPFDESIYLNGARWIHVNLMLRAQAWAPLYILWYRALAVIVPNPVTRYYVSWSVMVSFLSMLPVLWRIRGSLVYTGILLTLPVMLPVPYVSLFAGWPILVGLCLLIRAEGRDWPYSQVFAVATIATFIGAFSRPELQDGVIVSAAATIVCLAFERSTHTHVIRSTGMALTVLLLAFTIHYAAQHTTGNRSGFAFVDSVNLRASENGQLKPGENPWTSTFAQHEFGLDDGLRAPQVLATITDYFKKNPRLFLSHMLDNAKDIRFLVLFSAVVLLAAWPWVRRENRPMRPASAYMLAASISAFLGILFIYPREHYAMSMFPTLILYAVYVLKPQRWPGPMVVRVAGFTLLLAACTWLSVWRLQQAPFLDQRMHLNRIACARAADLNVAASHYIVYDSSHGVAPYVGQFRFAIAPEEVGDWSKFKPWAIATKPGWITINRDTEARLGISPSELDQFIQHDLGYVPHPCAAYTDIRIFYNPTP